MMDQDEDIIDILVQLRPPGVAGDSQPFLAVSGVSVLEGVCVRIPDEVTTRRLRPISFAACSADPTDNLPSGHQPETGG